MVSMRDAGDLLGALEEYRRLERRVLLEFGGEVSGALRRFAADVRVELAAQKARNTALPLPMTTFVGRRGECSRALDALRDHRHVAFVGPAGVGKSRIAVRVAWRSQRDGPRALTYVSLEGIHPDDFESRVAAAFSLENVDGATPLESVFRVLSERETLLVLDGCESVAERVGAFVSAALTRSATVRVLSTSRRRIDAPGEAIEVSPLVIPPNATLSLVGEETAVDFFADRAAQAMPSFTFDERSAPYVVDICRRLDGLPLALELAASRLSIMTLEQLHTRLVDRFAVLNSGSERSGRSLLDAVRFSYDLLDETQQTCFARLGAFRDGFTLEAAEAVCADEALPRERVLSALASLREHSLLVSSEIGGTIRFRLLETLWEFARNELRERADARALALRHAHFFGEFVMARASAISWLEHGALGQIDAEFANLRAALDSSASDGDARTGVEILAGLRRYFMARGLSAAMLPFAVALLDRVPIGLRNQTWYAAGLRTAGTLAAVCEDPRAERYLEGAVVAYRGAGDPRALAQALMSLGAAAYRVADYARSEALFLEALPLYEAIDERAGLFLVQKNLGSLYTAVGRLAEARERYELADAARDGSTWFDYENLTNNRANLAYITGDYTRGLAFARDALAICREHRFRLTENLDLAAVNAFGSGDRRAAWAYFREAYEHALHCEVPQTIAQVLEDTAWCGAQAGRDPSLLAEALGFARSLRLQHGNPINPSFEPYLEATLARLGEQLGPSALDAALARGATLDRAALLARLDELASLHDAAGETLPGLTERETEIARLVAAGKRSSEIAQQLFVSVRTVDNHLSAIYRKLGVKSRAHVVAFVLGTGEPAPNLEPRERVPVRRARTPR
jgi:non-specific serine/threonine protein kinase